MTNWFISTKKSLFLLGSVLLLSLLAISASKVFADGNDSPQECLDAKYGSIGGEDNSQSGNSVSFSVGTGETVSGVCIKTGDQTFAGTQHSGLLGDGGVAPFDLSSTPCYTISGVGTGSVTVTRNWEKYTVESGSGRDKEKTDYFCQGISHIDVAVTSTPIDVCPNIDGVQSEIPRNNYVNDNGDCVAKDKALKVKSICHTDDVGQVQVKNPNSTAYMFKWKVFPLPNILSLLTQVDAKSTLSLQVPWPGKFQIEYELNGQSKTSKVRQNNVSCEEPPVDVCLNLDGNQSEVPDGYEQDDAGNCIIEEDPEDPQDPEDPIIPQAGKATDLQTTALSCDNRNFDAKVTLTDNGQPAANVKVKFTYNFVTKEAFTNAEGKAQVGFLYEGNLGLKVEPDNGFPTHNRGIAFPENSVCEDFEFGIGGGDFVEPTEMAETGVLADLLVKSLGALGGMLTLAGSALYAKKNA